MCLSRSIRLLPLAGALIAGCATTKAINPAPDPRMSQFEEQNRAIDQRENQCIGEVMGSKNRVCARPGTSDGMKLLGGEQGRKLLACKAEAKRKREELSARVRATYVDSAQQERDGNTLMTILISKPH